MKAAVYNPEATETNFLSMEELEAPSLNGGEASARTVKNDGAIVKVRGCGVCGSDLMKLDRKLVRPKTVLGHEMVGEIFEIDEKLSNKYNLKKGDRIVSSHHVPCHNCTYCLNGKESLCRQFKMTNFEPGAFCEYLKVTEGHLEKTVLKIPESLSDEEASFVEPIACCLKAIKRTRLAEYKSPAKVVVIGLGSIGQILGQLVKLYLPDNFSHKLIGCDLLESKLELAKANGFDEVKTSLGRALKKDQPDEIQTENADFIFLSSGASATVKLALKHIKDGGTIVVFSSVPDKEVSFSNNDIYFRELNVISSYSPNIEDLEESLELLEKKKVKVKELITHKARLENLGETIAKCHKENGHKVYLEIN